MAQSFKPTLRMVTRVELMVWNDGHPHGNFTVSIRDNLTQMDLTSITQPVEDLPQTIKIWTEFDFPDIKSPRNKRTTSSAYMSLRIPLMQRIGVSQEQKIITHEENSGLLTMSSGRHNK